MLAAIRPMAESSVHATVHESLSRLGGSVTGGRLSEAELSQRNQDLLTFAGALNRLPEDQQQVLVLKHLQGCSIAEICVQTGQSKLRVAGLLYCAIRSLRNQMKDSATGPGPGADVH
jgi:DNA-directed RNA polymerase specialized sigma24 family protein